MLEYSTTMEIGGLNDIIVNTNTKIRQDGRRRSGCTVLKSVEGLDEVL